MTEFQQRVVELAGAPDGVDWNTLAMIEPRPRNMWFQVFALHQDGSVRMEFVRVPNTHVARLVIYAS